VTGARSGLQNRVLPTGEIVADPGRGTLMGNRGGLHDPDRRLGTARWRTKAWICCVLDWKGIQRDVMPPGRWTALFFLDEPTALAAGHRPCGYCRHADLVAYAAAWQRAAGLAAPPRAGEMDAVLHAERLIPGTRDKRTTAARAGDLPDGTMIRQAGKVRLLAGGRLLAWSWAGYRHGGPVPAAEQVEVLTPPSSVAVLAAGYQPRPHPSAAPA
jgi:hypothetical protein